MPDDGQMPGLFELISLNARWMFGSGLSLITKIAPLVGIAAAFGLTQQLTNSGISWGWGLAIALGIIIVLQFLAFREQYKQSIQDIHDAAQDVQRRARELSEINDAQTKELDQIKIDPAAESESHDKAMTQTRSEFEKSFEDLDERHHDAIAVKDAHIKAITESMNEEVDRLRTRHPEEIQKKDSELTDVRNTLNAEIMELRDELDGLIANKEAEILNIESQHRSQIVTRDAQIDRLSKANTGLSTEIGELKQSKLAEPKFDFQKDKDSAFVEVANAGEGHAAFSAVVRVQDPNGQFSSPSSLSWGGQDDLIAIFLPSDKASLRLATSKM